MEALGSSNHGDSKITPLSQETGNLTSSPLRKKPCRLDNKSDHDGESIRTDKEAQVEMNCVRQHRVEMTLFGAVCFHPGCMTRLGRTFGISHQTLCRHFDEAECYTGDLPDCRNITSDLCDDLSALRELVQNGGASADVLVERVLPPLGNCTTRYTGSYCLNCGLVGKPSALKRQHFTHTNKKCRIEHLRMGSVLESTTLSQVKIPEEIVSLIRRGEFDYDVPNERPKVEGGKSGAGISGRISGRLQSIEELSCQSSDEKSVSAGSPFRM